MLAGTILLTIIISMSYTISSLWIEREIEIDSILFSIHTWFSNSHAGFLEQQQVKRLLIPKDPCQVEHFPKEDAFTPGHFFNFQCVHNRQRIYLQNLYKISEASTSHVTLSLLRSLLRKTFMMLLLCPKNATLLKFLQCVTHNSLWNVMEQIILLYVNFSTWIG